MKSYMQRNEDVKRGWFIIDAQDKILGKIAVKIADKLKGKKKPTFTPHIDGGDFVIVINAGKVKLSGKKEESKVYHSHSGYPGGYKEQKFEDLKKLHPEKIIEHAVKGMLPKTKLGSRMFTRLKVYKGASHPHKVQAPVELK